MAGGKGTRLRPYTYCYNKHTILVYDKPLIFFPIQTLIRCGIEEIIINTNTPEQIEQIRRVLSGEELLANIIYHAEEEQRGPVFSLYGMKDKIIGDAVLVILGDMYLPSGIKVPNDGKNCHIYLTSNFDLLRISEYGVVELDGDGRVVSFEEKPTQPKGRHVHIGVTYFPPDLVGVLSQKPVEEGEHLVDLANRYLGSGRLEGDIYDGRHFNVGTIEDLFLASCDRRQEDRRQEVGIINPASS